MFTPLGLDTDYERVPFATWALMGLMALGTVAYRMLAPETVRVLVLSADAFRPWQFFSSMLLHGGAIHFLFNALFLWVFGRYVEERLGPWRFLALFLLFEVAGDVVWLMRTPTGSAIGASGAVAGCMGLVLFTIPKGEVLVHWRFGFVMRVRRLPVWFLLGFWILTDLWTALQDSAGWGETSTAYQAHLGGYLAGCLSCWVLRSPLARGTGWYLPRVSHGGERFGGAYGEMLQGEAMWRTIEQHQHGERDGGGPPEPPPAPPPSPRRPRETRPPARGFWG